MATAAEPIVTMTARLPRGMKDDLDVLARSMGRNRNALIQEALHRFIELQRRHIAQIEAGIREADAGNFATDEEMDELWAEFGLEPDSARGRPEAEHGDVVPPGQGGAHQRPQHAQQR